MRIGVLAAKAGSTSKRIRMYEAVGLLPRPQRRESGYRDYDEDALGRLALIDRGRGLGYTLKDIKLYLDTPADMARRSMLIACLSTKLTELDVLVKDTRDRQTSLSTLKEEMLKQQPQ